MARQRRKKQHTLTREEIRTTARALMAEKGTAGLSIRAIARKMDLTPPALYHYYASLNDIITALIADAFTRLADTIEEHANNPTFTTSAERLRAVAHAYRNWALANPIDFQLIYGNPIPDYDQPTDITYPPARRSFLVTANIFTQAITHNEIRLPIAYQQLPAQIEHSLQELTQVEGHELPLPALYLAASAWAKIHGHIMLELFNLIQPVIQDVDAFFAYETEQFIQQIGLDNTKRKS